MSSVTYKNCNAALMYLTLRDPPSSEDDLEGEDEQRAVPEIAEAPEIVEEIPEIVEDVPEIVEDVPEFVELVLQVPEQPKV